MTQADDKTYMAASFRKEAKAVDYAKRAAKATGEPWHVYKHGDDRAVSGVSQTIFIVSPIDTGHSAKIRTVVADG